MTNHRIQLYNLVLYGVFKMMIKKLFYFYLSYLEKSLRSKIKKNYVKSGGSGSDSSTSLWQHEQSRISDSKIIFKLEGMQHITGKRSANYQRWSPRGRLWPRGHILKSLASKPQVLKNCPVLGSRTALFFEQLKFRWKTPETSRKICKHLFCFPYLEHRRSQRRGGGGEAGGPPPPIEISPMTKM